jgi:hypothetical protein
MMAIYNAAFSDSIYPCPIRLIVSFFAWPHVWRQRRLELVHNLQMSGHFHTQTRWIRGSDATFEKVGSFGWARCLLFFFFVVALALLVSVVH